MVALQDYIDAQFGGPGKGFFRIVKTPAEARSVINDGKLAVVLGVEVSEVLDCGAVQRHAAAARAAQIDSELDRAARARRALAVPGAQVRQRARRHALRRRRHRAARQRRQQVRHRSAGGRAEPCAPAPTPTTRPPASTGNNAAALPAVRAAADRRPLLGGDSCPRIRRRRSATRKGLTALGEHLIRGDDRAGHDHRDRPHEREGARARRSTILEAAGLLGRDHQPQLG